MLKRFAILTILLCFSILPYSGQGWNGNDSTLYWMVNDSATVDGQSMHYSFLTPYVEDDDNWNAVRVKVVSPDGQTQRILNIFFDMATEYDGTTGMYIGDVVDQNWEPTGEWSCGVPTGNQSPIRDIDSLIAAEYYIQAELGRVAWNYTTDSEEWTTTLAYSKYEQLTQEFKNNHMYDLGTIAPPGHTPWTPNDFYTMNPPISPEPSSALLLLVGVSLLGLKRKKMLQTN